MSDRRPARRAPRRTNSRRALTAAAQVLAAPNRNLAAAKLSKAEGWQADAWRFYDEVGELRFGVGWLANALSRVNLLAASTQINAGDDPAPIGDPAEGDPNPTAVQVRARELVNEIGNGPLGQGQLLAGFATQLTLPGIAYMLAEPDTPPVEPDPDDVPVNATPDPFTRWEVLSHEQVRTKLGTDQIEVRTDADDWRPIHPDGLLVKVWRRHPRYPWEPNSPVRGVRGPLRQITLLQHHIDATAESRLAGAGLLVLPDQIDFARSQRQAHSATADPDTDDVEDDEFVHTLTEVMTLPLSDRGTAASVVPLVLQVDSAAIANIKHLSFSTPFDERVESLMNLAIRRLALGMDMPPETLLGVGGVNHWTAWQVAEEAIALHVEPLAEVIVHALTDGYLRPALLAERFTPDDVVSVTVWYDATALATRPDRSAAALNAWDRVELSSVSLRRELGFGEDDAPTDDERRARMLARAAGGAPTLAPGMFRILGYISDTEAALLAPVEVSSNDGGGEQTEPVATPDTGPPAAASMVPEPVIAACSEMVHRALERAGARLSNHARRASIDTPDVPPALVHTRLSAVACGADPDALLADAWARVAEVCDRYGAAASVIESTVHAYTRGLILTNRKHDRDALAAVLHAAALAPTG